MARRGGRRGFWIRGWRAQITPYRIVMGDLCKFERFFAKMFVCIWLIVDVWQEMHCKSKRATPSEDGKTELAAATAEEEPITAGAADV
jgi:hypothetical protein